MPCLRCSGGARSTPCLSPTGPSTRSRSASWRRPPRSSTSLPRSHRSPPGCRSSSIRCCLPPPAVFPARPTSSLPSALAAAGAPRLAQSPRTRGSLCRRCARTARARRHRGVVQGRPWRRTRGRRRTLACRRCAALRAAPSRVRRGARHRLRPRRGDRRPAGPRRGSRGRCAAAGDWLHGELAARSVAMPGDGLPRALACLSRTSPR